MWANREDTPRHTDGHPRRTIFIGYMPDDLLAVRDPRMTVEMSLREKQSFVYSKEMMKKGGAGREKMAARLEELGVERVRERLP